MLRVVVSRTLSRRAVGSLSCPLRLPCHEERSFNMKTLRILAIAAVAIANPAIAQDVEKTVVYEDSRRNYFRVDVQYSEQTDGREHCILTLLDRQTETVLSLIVPGSRSEVGFITFAVPDRLFGLFKAPEAQSLVFEFSDENGETTSNSALGYWDFRVEEAKPSSRTVTYLLLTGVDDLWGFARDWYDSSAVFVENGSGEDLGSMTLHRSKEGVQALADCWSGTKD